MGKLNGAQVNPSSVNPRMISPTESLRRELLLLDHDVGPPEPRGRRPRALPGRRLRLERGRPGGAPALALLPGRLEATSSSQPRGLPAARGSSLSGRRAAPRGAHPGREVPLPEARGQPGERLAAEAAAL